MEPLWQTVNIKNVLVNTFNNIFLKVCFHYVIPIIIQIAIRNLHNSMMQSVLGGSLHKNNTSYLLLGLHHASMNRISIVLMQITHKMNGIMGFVQVVNAELKFNSYCAV